MEHDRVRQIRNASLIAVFGNAVLAAAKILAGFLSGSLAVVSDGIDTSMDVVVSLVTLITSRIISKPPDEEHPYGHGRAETIATKILSFVILFAGVQLAWTTVMNLFRGTGNGMPSLLAIQVTAGSIVGKVLLAFSQLRAGKKIGSSMLIANGKNMQNDIILSGGVLVGLTLTQLTGIPVFDTITALAVSALIIRTGLEIFLETYTELMDGMKDNTIYPGIFEAVRSVHGVANPHRTRVRRLASMYIIDLDIEVDGSLPVKEGHRLAIEVEERIRSSLDNVYDVIVHVEPIGNEEENERYGLAEEPKIP